MWCVAERGALEAVVFDWGGTLTPWRSVDFLEEARTLALAAVDPHPEAHLDLHAANQTVWARTKQDHASATLAEIFATAGLTHDEDRLTAYREFWEPHTLIDPDVPELFASLRAQGLRIGVLSNTVWPRAWHEEIFARDGVLDLIDGAVYSSEIDWVKPAPQAFEAAMAAVGVDDPSRCVFVGDRPFEDIWGAAQVGMHTVLLPHSDIPAEQRGHVEGEPDAVIQRLADLPGVIDSLL